MCRNVMKQEAISVIAGDIFPAISELSAYIQEVWAIDWLVIPV